jgi:hypothetical protein
MSRASPRFRRVNPSLPAVGSTQGVVVYKVVGSIESQLTINTFFYLGPVNNPTAAQLTALLTSISGVIFNNYKACLSADWSLTRETLDVVHRTDINGVQSVANVPSVGGRPALHEPTEIAAVILRKSAFKGQHGRGRLSLPAISTSDVGASSIIGTALPTALAGLRGQMLLSASDGVNSWVPCIAQRTNVSPHFIVAAAQITSTSQNLLLGTIRRRKIGRGR